MASHKEAMSEGKGDRMVVAAGVEQESSHANQGFAEA